MSAHITESVVEDTALEWFEALGYAVVYGPSIAPGEAAAERTSYDQVTLNGRLRAALERLNPHVPSEGIDEASNKLTRIASPQLIDANHELHSYLVRGVTVEYLRPDGTIGYDPVRVLDYDEPSNNDWLVVNQLTITEGNHKRRPDVVVFVNGLPLAIIELKNAINESATIWTAFQQLQTYKAELPTFFTFNTVMVEMYKALTALRPAWHDDADDKGAIKIVMTGSAEDRLDMQPHIRSKARREALAKRFKKPEDPLKIVIVRDMWLTGFDAPCVHTIYVDKPMRGHGLMQAIARVNRVFRDKPGGLVVDYA